MVVHPTAAEDIRRLIASPLQQEIRPTMYRSTHAHRVQREALRSRDCHRTMGYAQVELPLPNHFLKKRTRIVCRPHVEKEPPVLHHKPPVPSRVSGHKTHRVEKDFKRENIMEAVRAKPKNPEPAMADTTHGDVQKLRRSGLMPFYVYSKNFGKVPKYLSARQHQEKEEIIEQKKYEAKKKPPLKFVTEEERLALLEGLKKNWEDLQKEFQVLPMVTDTVPKIKRKTKLEKMLKDLEKDIDLLERNPIIYVDEREGANH